MRKPCETTWHDPTHSVLQTMQLMSCTPGSSQISSIALAKRKWYGKCHINTSAFRATSTATWQALRWGHCIFRHHPSCTAVDGLEVWPATQRTSMNQESKVSASWTAQAPSNVQCMINLQISETPHFIQKNCPLCLRCLYDLHFWSCLFRCTTKTWPGYIGYMSWTGMIFELCITTETEMCSCGNSVNVKSLRVLEFEWRHMTSQKSKSETEINRVKSHKKHFSKRPWSQWLRPSI